MMNKFRKSWKRMETFIPELNVEEYGKSQGCCFFHDEEELKKFSDIDDGEESKQINDYYDDEQQKDYF